RRASPLSDPGPTCPICGRAIVARRVREGSSGLQGIRLEPGLAVGNGADLALAAIGHDPQGKIVAWVAASLDIVRDRIIKGDPEAAELHTQFGLLADGHLDPAVRSPAGRPPVRWSERSISACRTLAAKEFYCICQEELDKPQGRQAEV